MNRLIAMGLAFVFLMGLVWVLPSSVATEWGVASTGYGLLFPEKPAKVDAVAAAGQKAALSTFAQKFHDHLMVMDGGQSRAFDDAKLAGVKYFALYHSASWCGPCRAFTPDLVSFYNDFKPSHPNFELIFVNDDQSEDDMLSYMQNDSMPWPAVWYADIDNPDINARSYFGDGIPCLVLVDSEGTVLSDTYQDGQYTDPHHVIDDIRQMVK